jgi:hypothetical protein
VVGTTALRIRKHILAVAFWKHIVAMTAKKMLAFISSANADIAQLVEQVIRNDQVVGSNPTIGFSVTLLERATYEERVTQLMECN